MARHLVFDTQVVVDLWLKTKSAIVTESLLAALTTANAKAWITSTALVVLEIEARQEFERQGLSPQDAARLTSQCLQNWLAKVEILTVYGFEQADLYHHATCFRDAQTAAAARSLAKQAICIVTENTQFDSGGEVPLKTPSQALYWLSLPEPLDQASTVIPFVDLAVQQAAMRPQLEQRLERVLRHGQYILGPEVQELEDKLSKYTEAQYCITVASGTDALLISLLALGIGPGDEVVTTPFTFIATVEVIALLGAKPVFVDIDPNTCNLEPQLLEAKITPHTKAIMPVSLYGQPADMDAINAIAARYSLPVIEDAAQSFGADYRGRKSCNLSTIGCTSFFPSKPLGCYGDGGAIFTNDEAIADTCRELRVHGQSQRYIHNKFGVCARMDSLQCAVVLAKLERFPKELQMRQIVAARYQQALHGTNTKTLSLLPWPQPDRSSVFAQYTILAKNREYMQTALQKLGIPTAVHYPLPITEQPAYRQAPIAADATPMAKTLSSQVLSLPMGPDLSKTVQDRIIHGIVSLL